MKEDKIAMHTRAVNLARRFTEQNENDLMMVSVRFFWFGGWQCLLFHSRDSH